MHACTYVYTHVRARKNMERGKTDLAPDLKRTTTLARPYVYVRRRVHMCACVYVCVRVCVQVCVRAKACVYLCARACTIWDR